MQKGGMLKFMAAVTLLMTALAMDAAPQVSEDPHFHQVSLNRADQKPPDRWTNGPDFHERPPMGSLAKLLRTGPVTTYSIEHGRTVGASSRIDKTTSIPSYLDNALTPTNRLDRWLKTSKTIDSEEEDSDRHLQLDLVVDDPATTREGGGLHKRLNLNLATTVSNKQKKTNRIKMGLSTSTLDRREKLMKMLSALVELHRSMNSTLSSRITIITRGTSNGRNSGKKSKLVVIQENLKSTTASSVSSRSTSPMTSTEQADSRLLNGKAFKKSLPSTPKKSNKRVCFWKYCSQN